MRPTPATEMGLRALPLPSLSILTGYLEAVHQHTLEFLPTLTPDRLDASPDPSQSGRTIAALLRHLITHKNNHHGQVDYIRGLLYDAWDLPPGTGVVLAPSASTE